jgi:hypothetical protein
MTDALYALPDSVLCDPDYHPTVTRRVIARWIKGTDTSEIASATGFSESMCARIVSRYVDRKHDHLRKYRERVFGTGAIR